MALTKTEEMILPGYSHLGVAKITGPRTKIVTNAPRNEYDPGELVIIEFPMVEPDACVIPDSVFFSFNLEVNSGGLIHNNISKILQSNLVVRINTVDSYNNKEHALYELYKDTWLPETIRKNSYEVGITGEHFRKLLHTANTALPAASTNFTSTKAAVEDYEKVKQAAEDKVLFDLLGKRQRIKLCHLVRNHGMFAPFNMTTSFEWEFMLPAAADIIVGGTPSYKLTGCRLEYEYVRNKQIAQRSDSLYGGSTAIMYDDVHFVHQRSWPSNKEPLGVTVNVPRKSLKAVVILFKKTATPKYNETFDNPHIKDVKVTIEGVSDSIFRNGYPKRWQWEEAARIFYMDDFKQDMSIAKFFEDKYAFVIDCRPTADSFVHGNGKRIVNTQNGISLEIFRESPSGGDPPAGTAYLFIVSDSQVSIRGNMSVVKVAGVESKM